MKLETKVGVFFVGTLAVLGLLIIRTEKLVLFGKDDRKVYRTEFAQVAGLSKQGKVRIAGVEVGEVTEIRLQGGKALVLLSLKEDVSVAKDATASLSSIGILGEKYIELDPGHTEAGLLPQDQPIRSKSGVSLDNLMETLASIGQDVKGITGALNKSIGGEEGREKLDEIVDNIRVLTAEFRTMAQENHGAINRTMANAEAISGELRDRLPRLAQQLEDLAKNLNQTVNESRPELKGLMTDVRKLAQNFQGTSENLKAITQKINNGEGTIGKLLTDDATVQKINTAVDNVNAMLGGFKNMELRLDMNAARWTKRDDSRVSLGLEIAPRHDYWYSVEVSSTPDGKISDQTVTRMDPVTGLPTGLIDRTRTVKVEQAMTLGAAFNKRLGEHLVLSAGLVEGKGGAGAELRFLDDRFRFGVLGYDFSKRDDKPNPRFRATTSFQIWKGLYGQVGVQDIANKELRTFFFGGGLRWKDDDLKKLVGLAAGGAK